MTWNPATEKQLGSVRQPRPQGWHPPCVYHERPVSLHWPYADVLPGRSDSALWCANVAGAAFLSSTSNSALTNVELRCTNWTAACSSVRYGLQVRAAGSRVRVHTGSAHLTPRTRAACPSLHRCRRLGRNSLTTFYSLSTTPSGIPSPAHHSSGTPRRAAQHPPRPPSLYRSRSASPRLRRPPPLRHSPRPAQARSSSPRRVRRAVHPPLRSHPVT